MGRIGAFLEVDRRENEVRPPEERVNDFDDIVISHSRDEQAEQAARCMNCGVAFCQSGVSILDGRSAVGCPLQNLIPETNDLLYSGRIDEASKRLLLTNPFPEFTSRVCPAPCEAACNLGIHEGAVTIHDNERMLADFIWEQGIEPLDPPAADAPQVAIIGSGPAGLACAWELARAGWAVDIYEKADRPGGLLMYGIPSMKLPKDIVERRVRLMGQSGIKFHLGSDAAEYADSIMNDYDAVVLAIGAEVPREVNVDGKDLEGVYFAVDYLCEATSALLEGREPSVTADGKDVVVIGGGDTGVDCVATALRQHAKSVTQVIRAKQPPDACDDALEWPFARNRYTQGYGQREAEEVLGADPRIWSTDTIGFVGRESVEGVRIQGISYDGERHLVEGTERTIPAQLVLIAKGFLGADSSVFEAFNVDGANGDHLACQASGNHPPVFTTGDARCGATLVANAIADGLACAQSVIRERASRQQ